MKGDACEFSHVLPNSTQPATTSVSLPLLSLSLRNSAPKSPCTNAPSVTTTSSTKASALESSPVRPSPSPLPLDCSHIFCIDCIRNWRNSNSGDGHVRDSDALPSLERPMLSSLQGRVLLCRSLRHAHHRRGKQAEADPVIQGEHVQYGPRPPSIPRDRVLLLQQREGSVPLRLQLFLQAHERDERRTQTQHSHQRLRRARRPQQQRTYSLTPLSVVIQPHRLHCSLDEE